MELILDFYALGIQSAKETARQLFDHWMKESGNCMNGKRLAARMSCLNEPLKNELLKLL